jgi:hypothetical protein
MTTAFHPGGNLEIPDFDPFWETRVKHVDDDDLDPLETPVAEGESFPFEATVFVSGSAASTCTLTVAAPANSNGGFMAQGINSSGDFETFYFGADDFGSGVGPFQAGISGTLTSYHTIRIEGFVGAGAPGLVKITVAGATVKPGSHIHPLRIRDSRGYGA